MKISILQPGRDRNSDFPQADALDTFGKRFTARRKAAALSQKQLAERIGTAHSPIGKYKCDEMKPSIEAARRLPVLHDTIVAYLLGAPLADLLADSRMLRRLRDIQHLPER